MVLGGIPFVQLVMVRSVGGLIPPRFESANFRDREGFLLGTYNGHCQSFCETNICVGDLLVAPLLPLLLVFFPKVGWVDYCTVGLFCRHFGSSNLRQQFPKSIESLSKRVA